METPNHQSVLFETFFRQHYARLLRYAFRLTQSAEEADELVQEAFLAAWLKVDSLQFDKKPLAYLYKTVRNKFLNSRNHSKPPTIDYQDCFLNGNCVGNGNHCELNELKALIRDEVNHLPEKCREIFQLSREENLTYNEIANLLEISPKTVEHQISIALKRLRAAVDNYEAGRGRFSNCFEKKSDMD